MGRHRIIIIAGLAAALATIGAACGGDDGADVRSFGDCGGSTSASGSGSGSEAATTSASGSGSASASASASSSGSGSGSESGTCPSGSGSGSGSGSASEGAASGTGIAGEVDGSSTDNPLVAGAAAEYRAWVGEQVDDTIAATKTFTDAVRAGDLEGAKAAYAPSRQGWERIEPIAGLVEEIDGAVDARVDDFEGVDDPAFTGWHRLEYLLWEQRTVLPDGAPLANQLDADLQTLKTELVARRPPAHPHQRPRGRQPLRPPPARARHPRHDGAPLDPGRLQPPHRRPAGRGGQAQPDGIHRRHGQPRFVRRCGDGPLRLGAAR